MKIVNEVQELIDQIRMANEKATALQTDLDKLDNVAEAIQKVFDSTQDELTEVGYNISNLETKLLELIKN